MKKLALILATLALIGPSLAADKPAQQQPPQVIADVRLTMDDANVILEALRDVGSHCDDDHRAACAAGANSKRVTQIILQAFAAEAQKQK